MLWKCQHKKGDKVDATTRGIGQRIKELREARGLSQEKFGVRVGVTQQYVGALESGKRNPGPALVFMISKKFSTSEAWLKEGGL
jgi:transcriptional regulator with XRE-family HTH domain